jgi:hypothetical protein
MLQVSRREGGATVLTAHHHSAELFDPGHCRSCARQAGLLDHYDHVQREESRLRQTTMWARRAYRYANWALWASVIAVLVAVVDLLTG